MAHVHGVALSFTSFPPCHQFWFHYSWCLHSGGVLNDEFQGFFRKCPVRGCLRCKHWKARFPLYLVKNTKKGKKMYSVDGKRLLI